VIAASYGTAEDIEILWCIVSFVGVIYSLMNLREAVADFRFVVARDIRNGRRILARSHLWTELLRLCILSIFLVLGITALFIPELDGPDTPHSVLIFGIVARWGLLAGSAMLVLKTFIAKKTRDELRVGGPTELHTASTERDEDVDKALR